MVTVDELRVWALSTVGLEAAREMAWAAGMPAVEDRKSSKPVVIDWLLENTTDLLDSYTVEQRTREVPVLCGARPTVAGLERFTCTELAGHGGAKHRRGRTVWSG